jgi:hypothetical protein
MLSSYRPKLVEAEEEVGRDPIEQEEEEDQSAESHPKHWQIHSDQKCESDEEILNPKPRRKNNQRVVKQN